MANCVSLSAFDVRFRRSATRAAVGSVVLQHGYVRSGPFAPSHGFVYCGSLPQSRQRVLSPLKLAPAGVLTLLLTWIDAAPAALAGGAPTSVSTVGSEHTARTTRVPVTAVPSTVARQSPLAVCKIDFEDEKAQACAACCLPPHPPRETRAPGFALAGAVRQLPVEAPATPPSLQRRCFAYAEDYQFTHSFTKIQYVFAMEEHTWERKLPGERPQNRK